MKTEWYDLDEIDTWLSGGWELHVKIQEGEGLVASLRKKDKSASIYVMAPDLDTLLLTLSSTLQEKEE